MYLKDVKTYKSLRMSNEFIKEIMDLRRHSSENMPTILKKALGLYKLARETEADGGELQIVIKGKRERIIL